MSLSAKQIDFLNRPFDRTLDVAEGTPRSGKTTACILRFYDFLNTSKDSNFLVVGASQQQAFRLVMDGDGNGLWKSEYTKVIRKFKGKIVVALFVIILLFVATNYMIGNNIPVDLFRGNHSYLASGMDNLKKDV